VINRKEKNVSYYCDEEEMIREHRLRYIWQCPQCGYEYEDVPGYNEAEPCPECGTRTVKTGESYDA
jgi:rubrerythrin